VVFVVQCHCNPLHVATSAVWMLQRDPITAASRTARKRLENVAKK
jgi:hypothetical protein